MYAKYFHGKMAFPVNVVFLGFPVCNSVESSFQNLLHVSQLYPSRGEDPHFLRTPRSNGYLHALKVPTTVDSFNDNLIKDILRHTIEDKLKMKDNTKMMGIKDDQADTRAMSWLSSKARASDFISFKSLINQAKYYQHRGPRGHHLPITRSKRLSRLQAIRLMGFQTGIFRLKRDTKDNKTSFSSYSTAAGSSNSITKTPSHGRRGSREVPTQYNRYQAPDFFDQVFSHLIFYYSMGYSGDAVKRRKLQYFFLP